MEGSGEYGKEGKKNGKRGEMRWGAGYITGEERDWKVCLLLLDPKYTPNKC